MIDGYAQHGDSNDALKLFLEMISKPYAVAPNAYTISCILHIWLLFVWVSRFMLMSPTTISMKHLCILWQTALSICTQSACGDVDIARNVFDSMPKRNQVSGHQ
jgi:pentatricopeptide repeat protein